MSDVTQLLGAIDAGDPKAAEQLLPLVYDELRKLAAARLAHESPGQTLQATALVHEVRTIAKEQTRITSGHNLLPGSQSGFCRHNYTDADVAKRLGLRQSPAAFPGLATGALQNLRRQLVAEIRQSGSSASTRHGITSNLRSNPRMNMLYWLRK